MPVVFGVLVEDHDQECACRRTEQRRWDRVALLFGQQDRPRLATSQSLFQNSLRGTNPLQIMDECSGSGPNYPLAANLNWDSQNLVITSLNNFGSGIQFWNLALPTYPYTPPSGGCKSTPVANQYCRGVMTVSVANLT